MSPWFDASAPWTDLWAASLWRASWQGAIVLSAAWAVARWCRFLSPRVTCWVWRLACIKLLVALLWAQPIGIPILPAGPVATATVVTAPPGVPAGETPREAPQAADTRPLVQTHLPQQSALAWNWLLLLWTGGVVCQIALIARQWNSVRRLARGAEPACGAVLQQTLAQEASRLALRHLPRLHVSPRVDGPLLIGVIRPVVILPADAHYDRTELRLMIAHELAHLKRHDLVWNWLLVAVRSLLFFHPLVWAATKGWSEAQEAACDELLIQREVASPFEYGQLLLKLSTRPPRTWERVFSTASVLGTYRNLERRILAMSHVRPFSRASVTFAACVAVAIGTLGIVPWQLTAQDINNSQDQQLLARWEPMSQQQVVVATGNNLAAIMAAVHNYAHAHEMKYPPYAVPNPNLPAEKQLSGLVLLLPYLGEKLSYLSDESWIRYRDANGFSVDADTMRNAKEIYRKVDLQKAWDDPANAEAARSIIPVFLAPKSAPIRDQRGLALSHFAFVRGYAGEDNGAFDKVGVGVRDIVDGTVKTLAVGQIHSDLGPWLAAGPSTARFAYPPGESHGNPTFGSQFKQGWFAALGDASTCFVDTARADAKGLRLLAQRDDRTPFNLDDYLYRTRPEPELKKLMAFLKQGD